MKLNLGCGNNKLDGYINLDKEQLDLNKLPLPYKDNSVDEILLDNVLEHLKNKYYFILELYRIIKPGGILKINIPTIAPNLHHVDCLHSFDYFNCLTGEAHDKNNLQGHNYFEKISVSGYRGRGFFWRFKKLLFMLLNTEVHFVLKKVDDDE